VARVFEGLELVGVGRDEEEVGWDVEREDDGDDGRVGGVDTSVFVGVAWFVLGAVADARTLTRPPTPVVHFIKLIEVLSIT